jgi:hypothetical protein
VLFYSGNDNAAKVEVAALIDQIGGKADIAQQLILRSRSQFSPYQITRLSRYDGLVVHMGRT